MRKTIATIVLLFGLTLAVTGFVLAPPLGSVASPVASEPRLPFAAGLWTAGVMLMFVAPLAYVLTPERRS